MQLDKKKKRSVLVKVWTQVRLRNSGLTLRQAAHACKPSNEAKLFFILKRHMTQNPPHVSKELHMMTFLRPIQKRDRHTKTQELT